MKKTDAKSSSAAVTVRKSNLSDGRVAKANALISHAQASPAAARKASFFGSDIPAPYSPKPPAQKPDRKRVK